MITIVSLGNGPCYEPAPPVPAQRCSNIISPLFINPIGVRVFTFFLTLTYLLSLPACMQHANYRPWQRHAWGLSTCYLWHAMANAWMEISAARSLACFLTAGRPVGSLGLVIVHCSRLPQCKQSQLNIARKQAGLEGLGSL